MLADVQKYADMNGFQQIESNAFGRAMTRLGFGGNSRKRVAEGVLYKVYGCSMDELTKHDPPIVLDMDIKGEDALDRLVDYDEEDL